MKLLKTAKIKNESSKKHLLKYFFVNRNVIIKGSSKCLLVIFLTLFFNFISEQNLVTVMSATLLLLCVLIILSFLFFYELRHQKKVTESFLPFLNLIIMSMSMGKSFGFSVKEVSRYQNSKIKPFYDEVFQKIFVLREPKSGFWVKKWDDFYVFMFELSEKKSMQLDQLRYFRDGWAQNFQNQNRKQAVLMPVWIQVAVMIFLFVVVQFWQILNGIFVFKQFLIVCFWYALGLYYLLWMHQASENKI